MLSCLLSGNLFKKQSCLLLEKGYVTPNTSAWNVSSERLIFLTRRSLISYVWWRYFQAKWFCVWCWWVWLWCRHGKSSLSAQTLPALGIPKLGQQSFEIRSVTRFYGRPGEAGLISISLFTKIFQKWRWGSFHLTLETGMWNGYNFGDYHEGMRYSWPCKVRLGRWT